jgi:GNAT superfamily N-acetyltransferase
MRSFHPALTSPPAGCRRPEGVRRGDYEISTDRARLDREVVHDFLSKEAYWARGIPRAVSDRAIENSLCFGVYLGTTQVGFARVVTDRAAIAYLGDVFIVRGHRGRGLGKWLVESVIAHPDLQGLRRFLLGTKDAHSLYERFGFRPLARPERMMEIESPYEGADE